MPNDDAEIVEEIWEPDYNPEPQSWFPREIVTITNLETDVTIHAQFRPSQLEESLGVNYERLNIPGLSHEPLQYSRTGNQKYSMELYWRAVSVMERQNLLVARKFLLSACYPRGNAESVITGAPARLMFVWPNLVTMTCVLTDVNIRHFRFSVQGHSIGITARVALEEIQDFRLLAEEVWSLDTRRGEDQLWYRISGLEGWNRAVDPELWGEGFEEEWLG